MQAHIKAATTSGQPVEHDFSSHDGSQTRVINARHFALLTRRWAPATSHLTGTRHHRTPSAPLSDLEESERRFRELVESMDDGVYVSDGARTQCLVPQPPDRPRCSGCRPPKWPTSPTGCVRW